MSVEINKGFSNEDRRPVRVASSAGFFTLDLDLDIKSQAGLQYTSSAPDNADLSII